jgi:putative transposase
VSDWPAVPAVSLRGLHFWAKGYCVSTVGLDEQTIVRCIRNQEVEEKRLEQMQLRDLQTLS